MVDKKISIIIESKKGYKTLPLLLIDIDNYCNRLRVDYDVIFPSKKEFITDVIKKMSKFIKEDKFRIFERRISIEDLDSDMIIVLSCDFMPDLNSFRKIVESMSSRGNEDGYELAFGVYGRLSKWNISNQLGKALGSPIDIRFAHPILAFSKNIASSILSAETWNSIDLSLLAQKMGFSLGEFSVNFREGEGAVRSDKARVLIDLAMLKIFGINRSAKENMSEAWKNSL